VQEVKINNRRISKNDPVYFIADIASNHNGDLQHAKELIYACSESRVDAVKMQNFSAETIVSDYGFKNLKNVDTHQSNWKKSVYDSYKAASIPFEWTLELKELCDKLGMDYFTSPYSIEITKAVAPYISAFKLGSGDITWHDEIREMSKHNKPVLIATGASTLQEVKLAMDTATATNAPVILMQCNTNYTANKNEPASLTQERYRNINLKVLESYAHLFPGVPLGLSDHTHGDLTVLAAVALYDCCAVEKHFTLDSSLEGQDHSFSMMPKEWLQMVQHTELVKASIKPSMSKIATMNLVRDLSADGRYLDLIIGDGVKNLSENEKKTVIVQRRAIRAARTILAGEIIKEEDLIFLRPCPEEALPPYKKDVVIGMKVISEIEQGDIIVENSLD
jgi:sialic acid synthase SpsE